MACLCNIVAAHKYAFSLNRTYAKKHARALLAIVSLLLAVRWIDHTAQCALTATKSNRSLLRLYTRTTSGRSASACDRVPDGARRLRTCVGRTVASKRERYVELEPLLCVGEL